MQGNESEEKPAVAAPWRPAVEGRQSARQACHAGCSPFKNKHKIKYYFNLINKISSCV